MSAWPAWLYKGPSLLQILKAQKIFGHTFTRHGQGSKNFSRLQGRAAGTGTPQGQWLNDQQAANFLSNLNLSGPAHVRIPNGLGRVILPNGSVTHTGWAFVKPSPTGTRTAYPMLP